MGPEPSPPGIVVSFPCVRSRMIMKVCISRVQLRRLRPAGVPLGLLAVPPPRRPRPPRFAPARPVPPQSLRPPPGPRPLPGAPLGGPLPSPAGIVCLLKRPFSSSLTTRGHPRRTRGPTRVRALLPARGLHRVRNRVRIPFRNRPSIRRRTPGTPVGWERSVRHRGPRRSHPMRVRHTHEDRDSWLPVRDGPRNTLRLFLSWDPVPWVRFHLPTA